MNKRIEIIDIPKESDYIGYIWMSDCDIPITKDFSKVLEGITDASNPFIVEGQLYAEQEQKSYSIRYVDGKHIVLSYDLNKALDEYDDKLFIANRLNNVARIKFRQYWRAEKDELCEGMDTLVPAAYVFVGFEFSNKEKEEERNGHN